MGSVKILWTVAAMAGMLTAVPAALAAPPANDDFERAATVGDAPQHFGGTLDEATTQPGEPSHGAQSIWYRFEPSRTGRVSLEVEPGSRHACPVLAVYTGSALTDLTRIGVASRFLSPGLPGGVSRGYLARVAFDAVAGQAYHVVLASECEAVDSRLNVRLLNTPLQPNDAFANGTRVAIPSQYRGNLADATIEPGEPAAHHYSVWYRLRPRRTGKVTLEFFAPYCLGAYTWLYRGRSLDSLRLIAEGGPIRVMVRRGRLYHLAVGCDWTWFGRYRLVFSRGSIEGVSLVVNSGQAVQSVRARGLRMTVGASRRVSVGIDLRVSRRMMRRLGLKSSVLGRTRAALDGIHSRTGVIRLTPGARRALADVEHLAATVRVQILRSAAPNRVLIVPVRL